MRPPSAGPCQVSPMRLQHSVELHLVAARLANQLLCMFASSLGVAYCAAWLAELCSDGILTLCAAQGRLACLLAQRTSGLPSWTPLASRYCTLSAAAKPTSSACTSCCPARPAAWQSQLSAQAPIQVVRAGEGVRDEGDKGPTSSDTRPGPSWHWRPCPACWPCLGVPSQVRITPRPSQITGARMRAPAQRTLCNRGSAWHCWPRPALWTAWGSLSRYKVPQLPHNHLVIVLLAWPVCGTLYQLAARSGSQRLALLPELGRCMEASAASCQPHSAHHHFSCRKDAEPGQPGSGVVTWATRTGHLAIGDLVPRSSSDTGGLYSTLSLGAGRRCAHSILHFVSSCCWLAA